MFAPGGLFDLGYCVSVSITLEIILHNFKCPVKRDVKLYCSLKPGTQIKHEQDLKDLELLNHLCTIYDIFDNHTNAIEIKWISYVRHKSK